MIETNFRRASRHACSPRALLSSIALLVALLSSVKGLAQTVVTDDGAVSKAEYESLAAMYTAKTKMYEADAAAHKAKFGDMKPLFEGGVTPGDDAGNAEAQLLAVSAYIALANKLAKKVANEGATDVVLVTATPEFGSLVIFDARLAVFERVKTGLPLPPSIVGLSSVGGILVGAQALNALLGVVRTDFSVRGATVTGSEHAWTVALAGALKEEKITVRMPGVYAPKVAEQVATDHLGKLLGWSAEATDAIEAYGMKIAPIDEQIKKLQGQLATTKDAASKARIERAIKDLEAVKLKPATERQKWVGFQTALVTYIVELTSPDKDGRIALADIVRQTLLRDQLGLSPQGAVKPSMLLHTKLEHTVGSSYTKKNLFTSFGAMPFYVMGGASASVTLFNVDGTVQLAASMPWHSGFRKASKVEKIVNGK